MHRKSDDERIDFVLEYRLERDDGEPADRGPEKCSELLWADPAHLPADTIPYVRAGIQGVGTSVWFREFGWE